MEFLEARGIEMMKFGGVFVVHIDGAFAIGGGKFRLAAQIDRAEHSAVRSVDGGGIFASAVKGKDALGDGLVEDGVWIGVGFNGAKELQCFKVEDGDIVRSAVAGESAAEVGGNGDAVDALGIRDVTDDGVAVRIENDFMSAARDVHAAGLTFHVHLIPATIATNGNGFSDNGAACGRVWMCVG